MVGEEVEATAEWLTVHQVRRRVQCGLRPLYQAVRRGELRAVKVGTALRFRPEWVDTWMESLEVQPEATVAPLRPRRTR